MNSKKTITGEDEDEESELEYLTEIREVRDKQPDCSRESSDCPRRPFHQAAPARAGRRALKQFPSLLTYFRKGKLDKFFLAQQGSKRAAELDFFTAVENPQAGRPIREAPDHPARVLRSARQEQGCLRSGHQPRT